MVGAGVPVCLYALAQRLLVTPAKDSIDQFVTAAVLEVGLVKAKLF